ncbi:MAG: DUF3617 family protein [Rhodospirillales bacterium]|nr:DUF3617 family protein [Rhodospirillales bacterium]
MPRLNAKVLRRAALLAPLAIAAPIGLASASATFPPMRPGLWMSSMVMHMTVTGHPADKDNTPMVRYACHNAASMAAAMKLLSGAMKGCTFDLEGSGSNYTMTTKCTNPMGAPGTVTGNGTITTHGDTGVHFVENTVSDMRHMHMTMAATGDSKWVGACPAGIVPGDYGVMHNGVFQKQGNHLSTK